MDVIWEDLWGFNHRACKTGLNLLEAIYLILRKICRVGNRGNDGTGCF